MNFCFYCHKAFSNKWNLTRHVSRLHSISTRSQNTPEERTIRTALGNCTRMNHYADKQASQTPLYEKQIGSGHHQKLDPMETDSKEAESDQEDNRSVDVFDHDSDSASSENSSSEDSDDCESSSGSSSGDEDPDGDDNTTIPKEGVTHDGSVETVDDAEDEASQEHQPKYLNFARWRNSDNGLYSAWSSRSRKPHVVQHRDWLKKILKTPEKLKKPLINKASDSQLETFREIAANVLKGYVVMRPHEFNIMRKNKGIMKILASENSSYDQLRRTLLAARTFLVPLLVFFATPTCIKSENAALSELSDE